MILWSSKDNVQRVQRTSSATYMARGVRRVRHVTARLRVLLVPLSAIISCSRTSGLSSYNRPAVHEHEEALHLGRPVRVLVRRREDRDGVGFDVSHGEEIELGSVGEVFREV